jgi:hypothetical protein
MLLLKCSGCVACIRYFELFVSRGIQWSFFDSFDSTSCGQKRPPRGNNIFFVCVVLPILTWKKTTTPSQIRCYVLLVIEWSGQSKQPVYKTPILVQTALSCVLTLFLPFHVHNMTPTPRGRNHNGRFHESPLVLLVAVAMVSFFAGTVLTAHIHLGTCVTVNNGSSSSSSSSTSSSNHRHHSLNAQVEELAQKRLLGAYR